LDFVNHAQRERPIVIHLDSALRCKLKSYLNLYAAMFVERLAQNLSAKVNILSHLLISTLAMSLDEVL